MKFITSLLLLSVLIGVSVHLNEAYGPLIKNVRDKYGTGDVVIALGTNQQSFDRVRIWHATTRMLSNEGISTLIVTFKQFEDIVKVHNGRTFRSLTVIALDTIEELHTFESITKDSHMRFAVWLIFFMNDASRELCEFCRSPHGRLSNLEFGSKVLISCCESNIIEEWYTQKNLFRRHKLGRLMDGNSRIVWFPDELIHDDRYSMDGQVLRIAAVKKSPIFQDKGGEYSGYLGELLEGFGRATKFTKSEIIWEDRIGRWNPETSNGTGVIGRIHRQEADIAAALFYMLGKRNYISSTSPVGTGKLKLYIKKYGAAHLTWNAYFKTLTVDVWMAIMGLILTTPILLVIIKYRRRSNFFPLLFEQYSSIWGIYCQQGTSDSSRDMPSRMVYVSILISAFITGVAYSAFIISSLAVPPYPPFDTMEGFAKDGTYKLIVQKDVNMFDLLKFSDQELTKKLKSLLKPKDSLPQTVEEGFEQVCSNRVGFATHELEKAFLKVLPCKITSITIATVAGIVLIMPRGSRYLHLMNHHIGQLRGNGVLQRLERKYFTSSELDEPDDPSVQLQVIAPIILILGVGCLIAFIIFIIECNFHPFMKKLTNRKRQRTFFGKRRTFPI